MTPSEALARHIAGRIRAEGPLSVASYMEEALLHPQYGYYATRDPLGEQGDFITAPEVSQVFGELIGLWCADLWERAGRPDPVILAELGPGRGTLMADALRALRVAPAFRRALRLHLVERSAVLRRSQARALAAAEPVWHEDAAELPAGPLLLVANEFLDALPIRQFERARDGWRERRVGLGAEGGFVFVLDRAPSDATLLPAPLRDAPIGSLCEVRPAAQALARRLGARLAAEGGAALFIDYGHYARGYGDTLQGIQCHGRHAVLSEPGAADVTAHVDFATFAAAARETGAAVWGPVAQGDFLAALGIAAREAALLAGAGAEQAAAIRSGCRRLTDAAGMGTLFKAMALADPGWPVPAGFAAELPSC